MDLIKSKFKKLDDKETRFAQILEWLGHPVSVILISCVLFFILAPINELIIINFPTVLLIGILSVVSFISFFMLAKYLPNKEDLKGEQRGFKKFIKMAVEEGEREDLAAGITGGIDMIIFFTAVFIFRYPMLDIYVFACATLTFIMGALGLIRFIWKISIHCGISSLVITSFTLFSFWHFVWLYIFLVPIIYSRLKLKKHTVAQIIGGILIGSLIPIGLYFFVYLNPELLSLIQSLYST